MKLNKGPFLVTDTARNYATFRQLGFSVLRKHSSQVTSSKQQLSVKLSVNKMLKSTEEKRSLLSYLSSLWDYQWTTSYATCIKTCAGQTVRVRAAHCVTLPLTAAADSRGQLQLWLKAEWMWGRDEKEREREREFDRGMAEESLEGGSGEKKRLNVWTKRADWVCGHTEGKVLWIFLFNLSF